MLANEQVLLKHLHTYFSKTAFFKRAERFL